MPARHPPPSNAQRARTPRGSSAAHHLLRKTGLADARLPDQQEQNAAAREGLVEAVVQLGELGLAAHEYPSRAVRRLQLLARCEDKVERRILFEDRFLEFAERTAGLDPEFVDQRRSGPLVGTERLRLSSGAVEGEHRLAAELLTQGMLAHQALQLTHELVVPSRR